MKVFFVNDSTDNTNWGDRAAATTLKWMVEEVGGEITCSLSEGDLKAGNLSKRSQAYAAGNRDSSRGGFKEALKPLIPPAAFRLKDRISRRWRLSDYYRRIPETVEQFEACRQRVYSDRDYWSPFLDNVQEMDVAIIHGNGAMKGQSRMPRSILFLTYLIKKDFGKPVVIVNHTLDIDNGVLRAMVEKMYPLFDDVVFRESISPEQMPHLSSGRAAADTAFLLEPATKKDWVSVARRATYFDVWPDRANFDPSEPYLCVGGSSIYPYYRDRYKPLRGFAELIAHLQTVYSGQIVLTVSSPSDESFLRHIARENDLPLIGLRTPIQQAVDILGNAEAYVGGRWHPSIFALTGGTPVVALSAITFKIDGLMKMCGLSTVFDALALESEKERIGEQLLKFLAQGSALRERLANWAKAQADVSWENVAYLTNQPT